MTQINALRLWDFITSDPVSTGWSITLKNSAFVNMGTSTVEHLYGASLLIGIIAFMCINSFSLTTDCSRTMAPRKHPWDYKSFGLIFLSHLAQYLRAKWPQNRGVAVNRSKFSGRKDRGRIFWSNCRDRMECRRILSYLLYGSRSLRSLRQVATLRHGHMARRSASLRSCIQGTKGMWTYLTTL